MIRLELLESRSVGRQSDEIGVDLSHYLDIVRVIAAFAVFIGHAHGLLFPDYRTGVVTGHAREAVVVFFVISGFVVQFVARKRENTAKAFILLRSIRILPTAALSLLVTYVADTVGSHADPEFYRQLEFFQPANWQDVMISGSFLNEIWFTHTIFGSNQPYWSLCYEVCFYAIFVLIYFRGAKSMLVVPALALFGPLIALYFSIWYMGAALYTACCRFQLSLSKTAHMALLLFSAISYLIFSRTAGHLVANIFDAVGFKQAVGTYLYLLTIGLVFSMNVFVYSSMTTKYPPMRRNIYMRSAAKWLSGLTYTLYIVHLPILICIVAVWREAQISLAAGFFACIATFIVVVLLAEACERRAPLLKRFAMGRPKQVFAPDKIASVCGET